MKLTLRDLFWLILVVAMGCGWWVDRAWMNRKINELEARLVSESDLDFAFSGGIHGSTQPIQK